MAFKVKQNPKSAVAKLDIGEFPLPWDKDAPARLIIRRSGSPANKDFEARRSRLVPRPAVRAGGVAAVAVTKTWESKLQAREQRGGRMQAAELAKIEEETRAEVQERIDGMSLEEYAKAQAAIAKSSPEEMANSYDFDETRLRVAECLLINVTGYEDVASYDWSNIDARLEFLGFSGFKLKWVKDGRIEYLTRRQVEAARQDDRSEIGRGLRARSIVEDHEFDGEWRGADGAELFFPDEPYEGDGFGKILTIYIDESADNLEQGRGPALAAAHLDSQGSAAGITAT